MIFILNDDFAFSNLSLIMKKINISRNFAGNKYYIPWHINRDIPQFENSNKGKPISIRSVSVFGNVSIIYL